MNQAWNAILTEYVDRDSIDTTAISHGAIEGMVTALDDPYSSFLEPELFDVWTSSLQGEYEGIGVYPSFEDGRLTIASTLANSPAEKAGLQAGDVILEVDGEPVADMNYAEILLKVRGPRGTSVALLIQREGQSQPFLVEIVRDVITVPSVHLERLKGVACITITDFTTQTPEELALVLEEIAPLYFHGIILDIRGNPGGTVGAVVAVASHYLRDSKILDIRDNEGNVTTYSSEEVYPVIDLPLVVLVDGSSASGSEALAGALQDNDRAVIAGTATFGKGSVNNVIELGDGSAIYITTGRWLTPDGHLIEGQGIQPDIPLELTGDDAVQWAVDYILDNR
jgi:carboxyl-terminal processing protease